jgi:hypothetical protein
MFVCEKISFLAIVRRLFDPHGQCTRAVMRCRRRPQTTGHLLYALLYFVPAIFIVASYGIFLIALSVWREQKPALSVWIEQKPALSVWKEQTSKLAGVPAVFVFGPVLLAICLAQAFAMCTGVQLRATLSRVNEARMPELPVQYQHTVQ